jgi:hypothetical protein
MGEEPVPEEREVQMPGVRISVLGCVHLKTQLSRSARYSLVSRCTTMFVQPLTDTVFKVQSTAANDLLYRRVDTAVEGLKVSHQSCLNRNGG